MSHDEKEPWWAEPITYDCVLHTKMKGNLIELKSKYQTVQLVTTVPFGRQLVIDGCTQSSQLDEHIYHESLVHPVMLLHNNPKIVFIGGGGELAIAREVLKYKSVEKVIMVDIDKTIIEFARNNLRDEWDIGWVEDDPRFKLVIQDAKTYIEEYDGDKFDIVIMDIPDPICPGPGVDLYKTKFYNTLKTKMNENAFFVTQAGPCGLLTHKECFTVIHNTLKQCFCNVFPYSLHMPCFMELWGVIIAWNNRDMNSDNILNIDPNVIDLKISQRINKNKLIKCFDGITFRGYVNTPKYLRQACKLENRIIDNIL